MAGPFGGGYPGMGNVASKAAQSTAGLPGSGGSSSAGIAALLGIPGVTSPAPDPNAQNIMNTLGLPALANGLAANGGNQYATPQQAAAPSTPAPSLSDVLGALMGSAPTMNDFFSNSTYQQALQSLAAGNQAAQGSINSAYNTATNSQKQIDQVAAQNTANEQALMNTDLGRASNSVNAAMQQAGQFGGPGGQLQARLADLQGLFGEQQAQEKMMNDQLGAVTQYNAQQGQSALTSARANALAALAAGVQGTQNKITTTESSDQARAAAQYQHALQQYNAQKSKYVGEAQKALSAGGALGGKDWAAQQQAQWAQLAGGGDRNAAALSGAANALLTPIPSGTNNTPKSPTYQDAFSNLNKLAQSPNSGFTQGSIEYNILNNFLLNYFGLAKNTLGGGPSQQDLANYLGQQYGV